MTAKEIKDINREITRLKAKIARIAAEADNTSPKLSDLPSAGQTSDKVGNAVVQIADIQREIQNLEICRNAALNSLSRDDFVENCLNYRRLCVKFLHLNSLMITLKFLKTFLKKLQMLRLCLNSAR